MARRSCGILLMGSFFLFNAAHQLQSQASLSVKEIVEKNIQAAGGKENLSQVKNYSFRFGRTTYYMSNEGIMKLTEGRGAIITKAIVVEGEKVKSNCFNKLTELSGIEKSSYQSLAELRCGLFTLMNFKNKLQLGGLKNFGPKKHYLLTTERGELKVEFYIDSEEFLLKRLVFKAFDPSQGKYEVNHDFGPYQEVSGVRIPSSWFASQVGTRGSSVEISEVRMNQPLEKDFFTKLEVNVGEVKIGQGELSGNIVESSFRRNMLLINTNWTDECLSRAGFKVNDKLLLDIGEKQLEIDFYESFPPRGSIVPGVKFMVPNTESENYLIYLVSPEYGELFEKLEPLYPIRIKKKASE